MLPLTPLDLPYENPTGVTNIVKDLCAALDNSARICCPKIVDLCGKPHINWSFLRGDFMGSNEYIQMGTEAFTFGFLSLKSVVFSSRAQLGHCCVFFNAISVWQKPKSHTQLVSKWWHETTPYMYMSFQMSSILPLASLTRPLGCLQFGNRIMLKLQWGL